MKNLKANWFECKMRFERIMENGILKKVTETYVVDAMSFAEAEARFVEHMEPYMSGEFEVIAVKQAPYKEIFFMDCNTDSRWYKAKLEFITIDEKTEKEKRQAVTFLVEATSLRNALDNIDQVMKDTMIDYVQANVGETKIIDVVIAEESEKSE